MDKLLTSNLKLGIIAGGQLGKMLIQEASKWDISTYVLDEDEECPAASVATQFIKGGYQDYDAVYRFGKLVDLLTFEIEAINVDALKRLKAEGVRILPDPGILELVQDKGLQKEFYEAHEIPTSRFKLYESAEAIRREVEEGGVSLPLVQKLRKGGYDGRGVAVITRPDELDRLLPGASVVEEKVEIAKELSVIVARNGDGEVRAYPVVEMLFDPQANLADTIRCPASIPAKAAEQATEYARRIINLLEMEGLLAVEFFIDVHGEVLVNEMAPRPHNSGHHTIESVVTSQFEQHLRSILNLPLGDTGILLPSVMVNIVGDEGYHGPVFYEGLQEILGIDGANIHLYGKKLTRPFRKMGHITLLAETMEGALKKAERVKELIGVKACKES